MSSKHRARKERLRAFTAQIKKLQSKERTKTLGPNFKFRPITEEQRNLLLELTNGSNDGAAMSSRSASDLIKKLINARDAAMAPVCPECDK